MVSISEIVGMEGDVITMQEIYTFRRTGVSPQGEVLGHFRPTGVRPRFCERLAVYGFELPPNIFEPV